MRSRWKFVAGALVMALVLAACGGDDDGGDEGTTAATGTTAEATGATGDTGSTVGTVAPEEYVRALCTGMKTYVDDVTTLSSEFGTSLDPTADLQTQKEAVVGLLQDIIDATDTLITDLEAAGVPDVEGGDEIVSAVGDSFDQARQVIDDAKAQVEDLSIDDPATFATELTNIGTAIQNSLGGISGSLSELDAPELSEAAANEPSCASLAGTGPTGLS